MTTPLEKLGTDILNPLDALKEWVEEPIKVVDDVEFDVE